jgi:phosphatidylserine decarboxylase
MIRIHREGRLIVAITVALLMVLVIVTALFLPDLLQILVAAISLILLVLVLRFFRKPLRRPLLDEKIITAPADGKVVAIEKVNMEEFLTGPCTQVSIFMSIHDVHINYFPVTGKVRYLNYSPGKYLVARHPKSSQLNERWSVGIETPYGPLLVRQVAGTIARRIRCYASLNGDSSQGEEMGFIKFGSRLDLFLPLKSEIKVVLNQHVIGAVTPVAHFK